MSLVSQATRNEINHSETEQSFLANNTRDFESVTESHHHASFNGEPSPMLGNRVESIGNNSDKDNFVSF